MRVASRFDSSSHPSCLEVPSGFYLADTLLMLDGFLGQLLLVPSEQNTKLDLAGAEAKRLKRLMGALRTLFRNCGLFARATLMWLVAGLS